MKKTCKSCKTNWTILIPQCPLLWQFLYIFIVMELEQFIEYVESKYPVTLYMDRDGDRLILSSIVVPKSKRGASIGTKVMEMIADYADQVEMSVYLTPSTGLGASSLKRITNFYKGFGFKKKPREDFSRRESMVRYPNNN